jgi:hypothetical protein
MRRAWMENPSLPNSKKGGEVLGSIASANQSGFPPFCGAADQKPDAIFGSFPRAGRNFREAIR